MSLFSFLICFTSSLGRSYCTKVARWGRDEGPFPSELKRSFSSLDWAGIFVSNSVDGGAVVVDAGRFTQVLLA